jgi:predicted nuclease of predicted toxin-antitoxin system
VSKFLLDANLSPKTARFLVRSFNLDIVSLVSQGIGQLPDHEVRRLAAEDGRVIITLDKDYVSAFFTGVRNRTGIIYLDIPNFFGALLISTGFSVTSSKTKSCSSISIWRLSPLMEFRLTSRESRDVPRRHLDSTEW